MDEARQLQEGVTEIARSLQDNAKEVAVEEASLSPL